MYSEAKSNMVMFMAKEKTEQGRTMHLSVDTWKRIAVFKAQHDLDTMDQALRMMLNNLK